MTSQVALMNLHGVALASSGITPLKVGDDLVAAEENSGIWSIPGHQVQVLHYGNTLLGGVPHKIQFEAWTRTLTKPLPNIQAYVTSYKNYCQGATSTQSRAIEAEGLRRIIKDALNRIESMIQPEMFALIDYPQSEAEYLSKAQKHLDIKAETLGAFFGESPMFQDVSVEWFEATMAKSKIDVGKLIEENFVYPATPKVKIALNGAIKNFVFAAYESPSDTNLVFVGFGSEDEYAGSQRLLIRGIFKQKLLAVTEDALYVSPDDIDSRVIYSAQADAMKAFLQGFHPRFADHLDQVIQNYVPLEIASRVTDELVDFSFKNFITPALDAIKNMSPEQLAQAAKGLVVMQAAAAGIGTQTPTVGGPVEVSMITKRDGAARCGSLSNLLP